MAVASLAAILKPQILCLMQAMRRREGEGEKKTTKKNPNQSGLLDMVTRCAAAMAQIRWWQYKVLQNEKAEKRHFSFFPVPPPPLPPTTLLAHHIGSVYTRCSERTAFFVLRSRVLRNADLAARFMPECCVVRVRFSFHIKLFCTLTILT